VTMGLMATPLASARDQVLGGVCRSGQLTVGLQRFPRSRAIATPEQ